MSSTAAAVVQKAKRGASTLDWLWPGFSLNVRRVFFREIKRIIPGMDKRGWGECRTHASSQSLPVCNVSLHYPSPISGENTLPVVYRYKGKDKTKQKTYVDGEGDFGILSGGRGMLILLNRNGTFSTMKFV